MIALIFVYLAIGCVFAGLFRDKSVFCILSWPFAVFMMVMYYRTKK